MTTHVLKPYTIEGNENCPEVSVAYWLTLVASNPYNGFALSSLGCASFHGIGTEKDLTKALDYFRKSADLEDADGMYCLGRCLLEGIGCEQNTKEALKWLKKATAEDLSDGKIQAGLTLAECYHEGIGLEKNDQNAGDWIIKAIWPYLNHDKQDDFLDLDELEEIAEVPDVPACLLRAALYGHEEALSHFENIENARDYLRDHQDELFTCIAMGQKEAVKYLIDKPDLFLEKAESGDPAAMSAVGFLYSWGYFAEDAKRYAEFYHFGSYDNAAGLEWSVKAADAGYGYACYRLFQLYLKKDPAEAYDRLEEAAEAGLVKAQYEIGRYYLDHDMPEDADEWLMKAFKAEYKNIDEDLLVDFYYENAVMMDDRDCGISDELIILWCHYCIEHRGFESDEARKILKWLDAD